jgi:O-antigen/teichoic acid export membrane protein
MRSAKPLRVLVPTLGAILVKLLQLGVLVALSAGDSGSRETLIAGFGLLSAFAILADAGGGNYLLTRPRATVSRVVYSRVVSIQLAVSLAGVFASFLFLMVSAGDSVRSALGVLVPIALAQALDGGSRSIRAPILLEKRDLRYAAVDLFLFVGKAPIVFVAIAAEDVCWLVLLPLPSLIVAGATFVKVYKRLPKLTSDEVHVFFPMMEFGITGALSALYSQSPMIVGGLFLSASDLAVLAVVYRVVQPTEVLPSMLSQQLMPRIVVKSRSPGRDWGYFAATGLGVAVGLVIALPLVESVLNQTIEPVLAFLIIAAASVPKFGNYALVAHLLARGRVRQRLYVTVFVGVVSLALSAVVGAFGSLVLFGLVSLISEILLSVLAARVVNSIGKDEI